MPAHAFDGAGTLKSEPERADACQVERNPNTERLAWRWRFRSSDRSKVAPEVDEDADRPSVVELVSEHTDVSTAPVRDRNGRYVSTRDALIGLDD